MSVSDVFIASAPARFHIPYLISYNRGCGRARDGAALKYERLDLLNGWFQRNRFLAEKPGKEDDQRIDYRTEIKFRGRRIRNDRVIYSIPLPA